MPDHRHDLRDVGSSPARRICAGASSHALVAPARGSRCGGIPDPARNAEQGPIFATTVNAVTEGITLIRMPYRVAVPDARVVCTLGVRVLNMTLALSSRE